VDNLTHTLIGLAAGECVARSVRTRGVTPTSGGISDPVRRNVLLALGMVGGNLPDADLLWSMPALTSDPLAYVVQHRGYTHTLLGCAVLALLLFAATLAVMRWRGHRLRVADVGLLGAMALLAVMLHLGMDALNQYGVHPFWPWNNRWYYGDAVFIIEPLYWLVVAPLFFSLRTRAARWFTGSALVVGSIAVLAFNRLSPVAWVMPVLSLLLIGVGRRLSPRVASQLAIGVLIAISAAFWATHALVLHRVQAVAAQQFPGDSTLDIVLSPSPGDPLCWDVMLLQRSGADYVARMGQQSLAAQSCAGGLTMEGAAPLQPMQVPVMEGVRWRAQFKIDAAALARLAATSCDTRRLASFLRAPFAVESSAGWILGDLRFDRGPGGGFASMRVDPAAPAKCERSIPWVAPRRDLGL
jgi:inner membrane protein